MASHFTQYPAYDPYDPFSVADVPTGRRYSFGGGTELREFRENRHLLYPDCDHEFYTDPRWVFENHYHSFTVDAIFDGDFENEKPQVDLHGYHPHSTKAGVRGMNSINMAEDVGQAGSLFSPPVGKSMGEIEPGERIPADAMQVCDKVPATVPANGCGAQFAKDTQATRDTQATQDNGQLHERLEDQSGQEEPKEQVVETMLEKQNTTGSTDDDAGDIAPMSPPSPLSSPPESGSNCSSDYSSDSTSASSTGSSKPTQTDRRNNPNKRRYSDPPIARKKNKQTNAEAHEETPAARDVGPSAGSQFPPQDKTAGPAYSPTNPKTSQSRQSQMVVAMRPLQPSPVKVSPSDDTEPQISIQTPAPITHRPGKGEYSAEQKADQAACRAKGACTECRQNRRKCDLAKKETGEACSECAKRSVKLERSGKEPLTCVSWKNQPPQPPPPAT